VSKLSIEEVEYIARLSKLELTPDEKERYSDQLSSVLSYIDELKSVETDNVEATANVTGLSNIYREDKVVPSHINYDDIEKNAPVFKDGSFVVPGVFE